MLNIRETILAFKDLKILIIGDVMIDRYLYGEVNRISPEAPVPIVALNGQEDRPGGAANVALNIKSLGAIPILCSVVGKDESGRNMLDILPDYAIDTKQIYLSKYRKTTVKTRVLAQSQQLLRLDEEDTFDLKKEEQIALLEIVKTVLEEQKIDVILFQDYNKGVLSAAVIREVSLMAIREDIPTIVDPKNNNFLAYNRVTLFKPNLKEVNDNLPFKSKPILSDLNKATAFLNDKLKQSNTLITLSDKGVYFHDSAKQSGGILPTNPRTIADVCGAGDSVISIAALGLALQLPMEDIAQLANLAGGQVCERVGVVPVEKEQLIADYLELIVG